MSIKTISYLCHHIRFKLALYIILIESSNLFKNKVTSRCRVNYHYVGAKRSNFKVQHTNFDILIFAVFIYVDLGVLKALLNKYTDPSPLYSLSAMCGTEFKAFNIYLIKFSMFMI